MWQHNKSQVRKNHNAAEYRFRRWFDQGKAGGEGPPKPHFLIGINQKKWIANLIN